MRRILLATYGVCIALSGYLIFFHLKTSPLNYLFNVALAVLYALAGFFSLALSKSNTINKKVYICMGFGMFAFAIAETIWSFYNLVLRTEIPYPGLPDVFYISYYLFMVAGVFQVLKFLKVKINFINLTETAVIFSILFLITYLFLSTNTGTINPLSIVGLLNIGYPVLDSLLISLAILATRSKAGILNNDLMYFVFGFIMLAAGDTLFSYQSSLGTYWNGNLADVYFATSGILIILGVLSLPEIIISANAIDQTKIWTQNKPEK